MKHLNYHSSFFLFVFSLYLCSTAWAGSVPNAPARGSFTAGVQTMYLDYREDGASVKENGMMYGMAGSYTFNGQRGFYFSSTAELNGGSLDYKGRTWTGVPVNNDTDDWIINLRGITGITVYEGRRLSVIPFAGLGYRYWYDKIKSSGGYQREIQYLYLPLGIRLAGSLPHGWKAGINAEYDLFLGGWVKSYLSDADPGYNDPQNRQDFASGYGLQVSVKLQKRITRNMALAMEPFFRYWNIDRSDYADLTYYGAYSGQVYEPDNTSASYGLKLNIQF